MKEKTHPAQARIPVELFERLMAIKINQAHKMLPDSDLVREAIRLYVELAEHFGITSDLKVNATIDPYTAHQINHLRDTFKYPSFCYGFCYGRSTYLCYQNASKKYFIFTLTQLTYRYIVRP